MERLVPQIILSTLPLNGCVFSECIDNDSDGYYVDDGYCGDHLMEPEGADNECFNMGQEGFLDATTVVARACRDVYSTCNDQDLTKNQNVAFADAVGPLVDVANGSTVLSLVPYHLPTAQSFTSDEIKDAIQKEWVCMAYSGDSFQEADELWTGKLELGSEYHEQYDNTPYLNVSFLMIPTPGYGHNASCFNFACTSTMGINDKTSYPLN